MARIIVGRPQLFILDAIGTLYPSTAANGYNTTTAGDSVTLEAEVLTIHSICMTVGTTALEATLELHDGTEIMAIPNAGSLINHDNRVIRGPWTIEGQGFRFTTADAIALTVTYTVDNYAEA